MDRLLERKVILESGHAVIFLWSSHHIPFYVVLRPGQYCILPPAWGIWTCVMTVWLSQ